MNRFNSDLLILEELAYQRGFIIRDVMGEGHCCFAAVAVGLSYLGVDTTHQELRHQVCAYLQKNPYTTDGTHLINFVSTPSTSSDPWETYLQRMSEDEWADHIIVQALANMLCVDINVLCTIGQAEQLITCNSSATGVVNIGLIGELHYVALERQQSNVST